MNKETMQKLAEVLGLEVSESETGVLHINGIRLSFYFTLERMMRLAIEYRIDVNWLHDLDEVAAVSHKPFNTVSSGLIKHNGSNDDAERALKEAIALCVIAIKENE